MKKTFTILLIVATTLLAVFSSQAQPIQGKTVTEDSILVSPTTFSLDLQKAVKNPELSNSPDFKNWVKHFGNNPDSVIAHINQVFVCTRYANKPEDSAAKQEFSKLYRPSTSMLLYGWEEKYWVPMIKNSFVYTSPPINLRKDWTYAYKFIIRTDDGAEIWINDPACKTMEEKSGYRNSVVEVK